MTAENIFSECQEKTALGWSIRVALVELSDLRAHTKEFATAAINEHNPQPRPCLHTPSLLSQLLQLGHPISDSTLCRHSKALHEVDRRGLQAQSKPGVTLHGPRK